MHAVADFIFEHPVQAKEWKEQSNYIITLAVKDEQALSKLINQLDREELVYTAFKEPDINNQITAIAIAPSERARKITSYIPLALKEYSQGINKHSSLTI